MLYPYLVTVLPQVAKTLNVAVPGSLSTLLTPEETLSVTDLTLTGTIDSSDFIFMRDEMPVLSSLDISAAATVGNAIYHNALGPKSTLTSLLLPPGITRIGREALMSCHLTTLILPPALKILQHAAFRYCSIKEIHIPENVEIIESTVFASCDSLKLISVDADNDFFSDIDGVLFNKNATMVISYPPAKSGSYSLPGTVTEIGYEAFSGAHLIESLSIPASVSKIGDSFYANNQLTGFHVATENINFQDIDGVLFTSDTSTLIQFPLNKPGDTYAIPFGTEIIDEGSFNGCTLSYLSFPVTLTEIKSSAFRYCHSLISLELPPSLKKIEMYAFGYCRGLQYIRIPSSVTTIERAILYGADELDTICVNSVTPFPLSDQYRYFNEVDTNSCILMVPSVSSDAYSGALHWKMFQNIVEYETGIEVSQTDFNPLAAGDELTLQLTSNTEWRIQSVPPWLHFSDTLGMNSKIITVKVDPNTESDRQATVNLLPLDKDPVSLHFSQTASATALQEIADDNGKLIFDPLRKHLIIKHLTGNNLSIFSIEGKLWINRKIKEDYETMSTEILPEGIYVVHAGSVFQKIAVSPR